VMRVLVLLFLAAAIEARYQCTYNTTDGRMFDLNPLADRGNTLSLWSPNFALSYSPCEALTSPCGGDAVCVRPYENGQYVNAGSPDSAVWAPLEESLGEGVSVVYSGGPCHADQSQRYKTEVNMICSAGSLAMDAKFEGSNECLIIVTIRSQHACSVGSNSTDTTTIDYCASFDSVDECLAESQGCVCGWCKDRCISHKDEVCNNNLIINCSGQPLHHHAFNGFVIAMLILMSASLCCVCICIVSKRRAQKLKLQKSLSIPTRSQAPQGQMMYPPVPYVYVPMHDMEQMQVPYPGVQYFMPQMPLKQQ